MIIKDSFTPFNLGIATWKSWNWRNYHPSDFQFFSLCLHVRASSRSIFCASFDFGHQLGNSRSLSLDVNIAGLLLVLILAHLYLPLFIPTVKANVYFVEIINDGLKGESTSERGSVFGARTLSDALLLWFVTRVHFLLDEHWSMYLPLYTNPSMNIRRFRWSSNFERPPGQPACHCSASSLEPACSQIANNLVGPMLV